ncbi:MAG: hypothetical protein NZO16_01070 [Deltaproteobacteria bacterium]|nr:hypothetical protein [Deltaproteobacteria bacterium]
MRKIILVLAFVLFSCDESFFFSWDGNWKVDRSTIAADWGTCEPECSDSLKEIPINIKVDVDLNSLQNDYVFASLSCGSRCKVVSGNFDGSEYDVEDKSYVILYGNFKVESARCNFFGPSSRLTLGKLSNKRISFEIVSTGRNTLSGDRCRVVIFGEAKK